jgi:hypothetical protein
MSQGRELGVLSGDLDAWVRTQIWPLGPSAVRCNWAVLRPVKPRSSTSASSRSIMSYRSELHYTAAIAGLEYECTLVVTRVLVRRAYPDPLMWSIQLYWRTPFPTGASRHLVPSCRAAGLEVVSAPTYSWRRKHPSA